METLARTSSWVLFVGLCFYLSGCSSSSNETVNAPVGSTLSAEQKSAARDAVKALRKVDAASQVGVSYMQYGPMVIDAQAEVNNASSVLPDGELKKELISAIEAYNDAYRAWQITNKQGLLLSKSPVIGASEGSELIEKYSLPPAIGKPEPGKSFMVSKEDALNIIWKAARSHIDSASSLLNK